MKALTWIGKIAILSAIMFVAMTLAWSHEADFVIRYNIEFVKPFEVWLNGLSEMVRYGLFAAVSAVYGTIVVTGFTILQKLDRR